MNYYYYLSCDIKWRLSELGFSWIINIIGLWATYGLCCNYTTLSLYHESSSNQYVNKWPCANKTLFLQKGSSPDLTHCNLPNSSINYWFVIWPKLIEYNLKVFKIWLISTFHSLHFLNKLYCCWYKGSTPVIVEP